jgi:YHS domain-containing protein
VNRLTHQCAISAGLMMLILNVCSSATLYAADAPASGSNPPRRNTPQWNLDSKTRLAINGYDPVAYFPEGGGKAAKGDAKFTTEYKGATYRFVSADHKEKFLANPARYEPAHGGWCSWAMQEGDKVEIDPTSFIVRNDRLFLFYNGFIADTRSKWLKGDHNAEARSADGNWRKLSGEEPRMTSAATQPATTAPAAEPAPKK